ncbi:serine-rich adhesin for platelets-like [Drosophila innubila]|uniref:serine-rich adhesin for platelets-like n=1 Tax=Drosophila innubila TaxID=198719 RepID=UPI00148C3DA0|nr:serine-rich adhesin for platelets-like [Drosophila innubila]
MLQPRLTVKKPDGNRKRCYWNLQKKTIECGPGLSHKIMQLSLLFGLFLAGLIATPTVAADELNIKPTPALRLADDFTTVLLVNNDRAGRLGDGHGRYLSVRPEVGLLTSTARTFIQEGITTEYATQVVGTTLDNGRLYAQYLKKSSRVLFENGQPSVVTSWVGDSVPPHSRSYLQSHNDLFNADAPNWRDIDDSLDDIASVPVPVDDVGEFVGNTDFLKIKGSSLSLPVETTIVSKISKESLGLKSVVMSGSGLSEDTVRKLAAQKVLPIGDLPTFTVKNHFEPSGYQEAAGTANTDTDTDTDTNTEEGRSAKVYYQHLMREKQSEHGKKKQQLLNFPKRLLSTVTYYGFADFTTIVGDSVIVFSPSTAQPSSIIGHVTSIKGMATLRTTDDIPLQYNKVSLAEKATTRAEIIVSTVLNNVNIIEAVEDTSDTDLAQVSSSQSIPEMEINSLIATATPTPTLDGVRATEESTSQSPSPSQNFEVSETEAKSMFSLPTDQEIQEIYASLAKAQAKEQSNLQSTQSTITESMSESKSVSDLQGHSGATTIFIDDDPFANFIEPTRVINNTVTAISNTIDVTTAKKEEITNLVQSSEIKSLDEESTPLLSATLQSSQVDQELTNNRRDESIHSSQIKESTQLQNLSNMSETESELESDSVTEFNSQSTQADDITTMIPLEETETEMATTEETMKTESSTEKDTDTEEDYVTEPENNQETENDTDTDIDNENEDYDGENGLDEIDVIYKTLYTTYTYLTTFFQGKSTTVSSHTEIVTNVITSEILNTEQQEELTKTVDVLSEKSATQTDSETIRITATATVTPSKYIIPDELESLLHASANDATHVMEQSQDTTYLDDAKYTKTFFTTYTYYTTIFADSETEIMSRTEVFTNYVTELATATTEAQIEMPSMSSTLDRTASESSIALKAENISGNVENGEEHITLITDVRSSSSSGDQQQHLVGQLKDSVDDQVSSESNTEEILPSATLLLQTSFTTFTFYTTMYVSDITNVVSRLETVTNIATETVQPTKMLSQEEATLPITYFTTFTYWTKLAKDGEITTISREETISNVIEPTKRLETETSTTLSSITIQSDSISIASDNLEKSVLQTLSANTITSDTDTDTDTNTDMGTNTTDADLSALTTYYTTYTYYTTSYEANNTVTDSRLETITNIIRPTNVVVNPSPILSSINSPDPYDVSPPISGAETNSSDLIFYDYKRIIDAEGVSTLYFTTKIESSINEEGSRIEFTTSTSSLDIDETKKLSLATSLPSESLGDQDSVSPSSSSRQYKTGLVRLIEGTRIGNSTTTLYQSKVIGTIIDNRYAQIIESTSSFLFNKASPASIISPSATLDDMIVSTTQGVNLESPNVVEGSINSDSDSDTTETITEHDDAITDDDNNINNNNNARIPFQSKKRTFAPVIRPFASRNRPTFAPKQKTPSPSSATIITRSDITPTITATPALKSVGRFGSSRRGSSSILNSNTPNNPQDTGSTSSSSSRRLFGRPIKASSGSVSQLGSTIQASSGISPTRNRFASTFRTSGIQASSSRRLSLSSAYRPSSSNINGFRVSALSGVNSRQRIKPTSVSGLGPAFGKTSTSGVEEENSTEEQQIETNDEEDNATENSKRNQNPLLRFRRPLSRPIGFTPAPRNANNNSNGRAKASTTTTTTTTTTARPRPRSFQRPTISSIQTRIRPQNALFPPRGLFQTQQQKESDQSAVNNSNNNNDSELNQNETDDSEYDDDDDDADGEEDEDGTDDDGQKEENRRRRSNKKSTAHSRVRRQADTLNRSRFRFRRPKTATTEEPKPEKIEEVNETTLSTPRSKINSRFGSRFHSQSQSQSSPSSATQASTSGHRSIRPTRPTSPRTQFTLREKDTTIKSITRPGAGGTSSSNFRRQQQSSLRRTTSSPSSRRLKSYTSHNHNHNTVDPPGLRTTGTSRSRNNGNAGGSTRGRGSMRGRGRNDYSSDPNLTDLGSATITVTHVIPAEVTVPVVNGQVTEYKNIVTGKTSIEVLGPNQYTKILGNNGQASLYLTREDTSISPAGVTELTRYLLHDTTTTTVTFTPTTIRGRKTSFSHILPSTVYSVENVVSTVQPQISANAPLANILLSQLLLGNINLPANQLLGALGQPQGQSIVGVAGLEPSLPPQPAPQPQTEYRTHTSTYVTTIYDGKSTILPITFQGKKILTTVFDTTAQTITATEYSVDTIINTPTQQPQLQQQQQQVGGQVAQVNSLLLQQLLLQQQQQQQQQQIPQVSHTTMPQIFLGENLQDLDDQLMLDADIDVRDNIDDIIVSDNDTNQSRSANKSSRKKPRKSGKSHKRHKQQQQQQQQPEEESSVITLYVSGRRPGEFSTILSTVHNTNDHASSLHKRQAMPILQTAGLNSPEDLYEFGGSEKINLYSYVPLDLNLELEQEQEQLKMQNSIKSALDDCQESAEGCESKTQTASLESIIGDVDLWYAKATKQALSTSTSTSTDTSSTLSTLSTDQLLNVSQHFLD